MSSINDLLSQITDSALRAKLETEINKLTKHKKFGLVFEDHLPERTPLYDIPIKKNSRVALKSGKASETFNVLSIDASTAICQKSGESETVSFPVDELVPVAEFGEPIYPYLKPLDSVCNGDENGPWHTLIEADNYHALQLLEYLYAGKVDCIYIDPPYNTGARDWKYNNDYVDGNDAYRHSKWLSMMQKRLKLAKKLLNPKDSVLIVTIDEKEYLHLGCLLEEMFPESRIQMISSLINPKGVPGATHFVRQDEYIYFVHVGDARPQKLALNDDFRINASDSRVKKLIRWQSLAKTQYTREGHPETFYPIYLNSEMTKIVEVGDPIGKGVDRNSIPKKEGLIAVWPINKTTGVEAQWSLSAPKLRNNIKKGYVRVAKTGSAGIYYLTAGVIRQIESGEYEILGRDVDGSIMIDDSNYQYKFIPGTQWRVKSHDATEQGTKLLQSIIGNRFSYPKSLYAVADCLRFAVNNKSNALVVDFFAGSGTTQHALDLINAEDGGKRRCIMVTNNEVSSEEAKSLTKHGYQPGDDEWESLGIARYVTWPRAVCSIKGSDVNGNPIKGNYIGSDRPMADGFKANAAFFKLGFLDKTSVALGRQFKELLPVLWMKSGCYGHCPSLIEDALPEMLVLPQNRMAVLLVESAFEAFKEALEKHSDIQSVYLVTDYEGSYQAMSKQLNVGETYQLYRDYLDNFRINNWRG